MLFHQSVFEGITITGIITCEDHTVCTTPLVDGGNICSMDEGGPLYKINCSSRRPMCLYGIATYHKGMNIDSGDVVCNGGSYFASVTFYRDWITTTIIFNT
ncbi:uncharacterized protein LOC142348086 [Convolutriloba macropyga]|uniref:uncharacterized protein LOC142348086 n=1 Tax=Convolutriloba macropyga TaxID=536237 RepID=UPI003F52827C